jgi:hypothetical protein
MARAPSGPNAFPAKQSASANAHNYTTEYPNSDIQCSESRLTFNNQPGEGGVAFQRTRYGTCTLRPKFIPCKAKQSVSANMRNYMPHTPTAAFNEARANSHPISRLVRVELRSSALDMARAPSGPKALSAKQSASANTHNYLPAYPSSDIHCSESRLTVDTEAGEGVVAFQRTRYDTCILRPKCIVCKAKRVSKHAQLHARIPQQRHSLQREPTHIQYPGW